MSEHKEWRNKGFGRYDWVSVSLCDRCKREMTIWDVYWNNRREQMTAHRRVQDTTAHSSRNELYPDLCVPCNSVLYKGEDDYTELQPSSRLSLREQAERLGIELSF